MGNSQLVQWNFHFTFRSVQVEQRGKNSSPLDTIQQKYHSYHDLQTTTNTLNFSIQKLFSQIFSQTMLSLQCEPATAAN